MVDKQDKDRSLQNLGKLLRITEFAKDSASTILSGTDVDIIPTLLIESSDETMVIHQMDVNSVEAPLEIQYILSKLNAECYALITEAYATEFTPPDGVSIADMAPEDRKEVVSIISCDRFKNIIFITGDIAKNRTVSDWDQTIYQYDENDTNKKVAGRLLITEWMTSNEKGKANATN